MYSRKLCATHALRPTSYSRLSLESWRNRGENIYYLTVALSLLCHKAVCSTAVGERSTGRVLLEAPFV